MPGARNVAVLVGNGLSIAFNPQLNLQSLTEEVMRRIQAADGDDVIDTMRAIAERALPLGVTSAADFEQLVGAFGAESRTLAGLADLADLTDPSNRKLRKAIRRVLLFVEQVKDTGVSHVLEVIAERSHASVPEASNLHNLVKAITSSFDGNVAIGNLNYDTLLLAALLWVCQSELADMGHGYKTVSITVNDEEVRRVQALRAEASDFPSNKRVRLLHLHGSLTYWANKQRTIFAKLPKELLTDGDQWKAVRERTTNVRPVVVLANPRDKSDHVDTYPFRLAYELFQQGMAESDFWLVIGYSFKDEPVNRMLRHEYVKRDTFPTVLVVTYGDSPKRSEVETAFGWSRDDGDSRVWLRINRSGANGIQDSSDWEDFVDAG